MTKRRSQIKQSVTKMIQECCTYVDSIKDRETQLKFIETLRTVTAGKIYVEVERARLTLKLSHMKEAEGKTDEAANVLQELQVETYGSMEKREKVELILEQMRLCLAKKDYVRTQIISKKVQIKYFEEKEMQELKFKFYNLMIELDQNEDAFLSICKHYMAIYNTPSVKEDAQKRASVLKNAAVYIILAPYDNEQSDLISRLKWEKPLAEIDHYEEILKLFTTWELINWNVWEASVSQLLRNGNKTNPLEAEPTGVFAFTDLGNKRWADLKNRVVEHVRISIALMPTVLSFSFYLFAEHSRDGQVLQQAFTEENVRTFGTWPSGMSPRLPSIDGIFSLIVFVGNRGGPQCTGRFQDYLGQNRSLRWRGELFRFEGSE